MLDDGAEFMDDTVRALFIDATRSTMLLEWSMRHDAEPATVLLAAELARGTEVDTADFIEAFVAMVRGKHVSEGMARRFLLWLWESATGSIRSRLISERDMAASEAVMEMHRRTMTDDVVSPVEWRAARKGFAESLSPDAPRPAVEAIVASLWNLRTTPGAIADVAASWVRETALVDSVASAGWTWTAYADVQAKWDAFGIAYSSILREDGEDDAAFQARKQRYMQANPPAISEEDYALWKTMSDIRSRIAEERVLELRTGLLALRMK